MRRGLQVLLAVVGVVAVVAGASAVLTGASQVRGGELFSANVDSEFRFFAAWYVVAGALLLSAARNPERHAQVVLAAAAGFFLGAVGRLLSLVTVGAPSGLYVVLMVIEFALAMLLPLWTRRVVGKAPATATP